MNLLCYADLQATDGSERCFADPSVPLQHQRVVQFYKSLLEIYKAHKCVGLIDLGDTTDDRSSIPVPTIDAVINGLQPFPDSEWNVKIIGNHEQFLRDTSINVGSLFQSKFTVIPACGVIEHEDLAMVFAAYPESHDTLTQTLKSTAFEYRHKRLVLFGHFQTVGAMMASGEALTGVPKQALKPFKFGLLGHIHTPQTVMENIHYIGSPFQQDFGEAGEDKRVAVLNTDTLQVTWVPMTGFPCYHKVSLYEFEKSVDANSEDRFRVVIKNQKEATRYFQHPLAHRASATYDYEVKTPEKPEGVQDDWSFDTVLKRYLNRVPPNASGVALTAEEMTEIGIQIANE